MYPRSFFCEEAKIKQQTSAKKNFVKSVRKQYGDSDSHFFLYFLTEKKKNKKPNTSQNSSTEKFDL